MTEQTQREALTLEKIRQETKRAEAQAAAAMAEAEDFRSNAIKNLAEAETLKYDAIQGKLEAEKAERDAREELADNKYYKKYNFTSAVDGESTQVLMSKMETWSRLDPGCDMEIVFSSPGGSVIDGMALFDFIQGMRTKGHKVTTGAIGYAASMAGILVQAGDVRWMGKECPTPDQPVLMEDLSWKPAGHLEVGDKILSVEEDSHYRGWKVASVTAVGRAYRPSSVVRLKDGTELVASDNHGWLTKGSYRDRGWTQTKGLNKNGLAKPSHVKRLLDPIRPLSSWEIGWMAGILDGEGCLYGKRGEQSLRVDVVQSVGLILNEIKHWLDHYNFTYYIHENLPTENHKAREHLVILGGIEETLRLLALTRPKRLLARLPESIDGMRLTGSWIPVESVKPIGVEEVVSLATSSGTFVGSGIAQHNSYILVHEVSFGAMGKIGEVEDEMKFVKKIQNRVIAIFAERCKQAGKNGTAKHPLSASQIKDRWERRDWWIESDEGLDWGFVDEIR